MRTQLIAALLGVGLVTAACGGGSTVDTAAAPGSAAPGGEVSAAPGTSPAEQATAASEAATAPSEASSSSGAAASSGASSPATAASAGGGAPTATEGSRRESKLPSVPLLEVNTGKMVDLADYGRGDKPILVWAWAPH